MAGRTPAQAIEAFLAPIRLAVSCVTREQLQRGHGAELGRLYVLTLARGEPVALRGSHPFNLSLSQRFRVVEVEGERGPFKTQTAGYLYSIDTEDGQELVAYHWHPDSAVTVPHLHLGAAAAAGHPGLSPRAHVPTGRISIEEVVRFAIAELGVEPIREDWEEQLDTSQGLYEAWRTWPSGRA